MRSSGNLLVKIPKKFKDELQLSNGRVLYLDGSYDKFKNRVVDGILHSVPPKWNHIFQEGDRVFFHHSLVTDKDDSCLVDWRNGIFTLNYTEEHSFNCLVYLIERGGKRFTVNDFVFTEPIQEEQYKMIGSLYVPDSAKPSEPWRAKVVYLNDYVRESMGVEEGDVIVFTRDRASGKAKGAYEMDIDGTTLWRMRSERNILAVVEHGETEEV